MLLALLALEYSMGWLAYSAFDFVVETDNLFFDAFALYFFALMAIDAAVCKWMLSFNSSRAITYACLNIVSIIAHFYGLTVFINGLDKGAYSYMLEILLYAKIIVVVMPDVRRTVRHIIDSVRGSLVYSPSVVFATSALGVFK